MGAEAAAVAGRNRSCRRLGTRGEVESTSGELGMEDLGFRFGIWAFWAKLHGPHVKSPFSVLTFQPPLSVAKFGYFSS